MRITILLDPRISDFGALETDLKTEIVALSGSGVSVTTMSGPPPERTLPLEQVSQFIIEHADDLKNLIPLIRAALQVTVEVLRRRGVRSPSPPAKPKPAPKKTRPKQKRERPTPPVLFTVDGHALGLPSSAERQRRFLATLQERTLSTGAAARTRRARRSPGKPRR